MRKVSEELAEAMYPTEFAIMCDKCERVEEFGSQVTYIAAEQAEREGWTAKDFEVFCPSCSNETITM